MPVGIRVSAIIHHASIGRPRKRPIRICRSDDSGVARACPIAVVSRKNPAVNPGTARRRSVIPKVLETGEQDAIADPSPVYLLEHLRDVRLVGKAAEGTVREALGVIAIIVPRQVADRRIPFERRIPVQLLYPLAKLIEEPCV